MNTIELKGEMEGAQRWKLKTSWIYGSLLLLNLFMVQAHVSWPGVMPKITVRVKPW
jgi:hypothetical protein